MDPQYTQILLLAAMFAVFYFVLLRPQQVREKKQKEFAKNLKEGDTVVTNSGIYGKIVKLEGNTATVEIARNTKVKMDKGFISRDFTDQLLSKSADKKAAESSKKADE